MLEASENVFSSKREITVMGSSSCSTSSHPSSFLVSKGSDEEDESLRLSGSTFFGAMMQNLFVNSSGDGRNYNVVVGETSSIRISRVSLPNSDFFSCGILDQ